MPDHPFSYITEDAERTRRFLSAPGTMAAACGVLLGVADIGIAAASLATGPKLTQNSAATEGINIAADATQLYVTKRQIQNQINRILVPHDMASIETFYSALTILCLTFDILTLSEQLNGMGAPNEGQNFTKGESDFGNIESILTRAFPDENQWFGNAADHYRKLNQQQYQQLTVIAAADEQIAHITQHQAGQVNQAREGLAGTRAGLTELSTILATSAFAKYASMPSELQSVRTTDSVIPTATGWEYDPNNPFAISANAQEAVINGLSYAIMLICFLAAISMFALFGILVSQGRTNADDIHKVIDDYYTKVATAPMPAIFASTGRSGYCLTRNFLTVFTAHSRITEKMAHTPLDSVEFQISHAALSNTAIAALSQSHSAPTAKSSTRRRNAGHQSAADVGFPPDSEQPANTDLTELEHIFSHTHDAPWRLGQQVGVAMNSDSLPIRLQR